MKKTKQKDYICVIKDSALFQRDQCCQQSQMRSAAARE